MFNQKTPNSKYRKSNHSISAARQAGGAARFRRALSKQRVIGAGGGAEGSRHEKGTCPEREQHRRAPW